MRQLDRESSDTIEWGKRTGAEKISRSFPVGQP